MNTQSALAAAVQANPKHDSLAQLRACHIALRMAQITNCLLANSEGLQCGAQPFIWMQIGQAMLYTRSANSFACLKVASNTMIKFGSCPDLAMMTI